MSEVTDVALDDVVIGIGGAAGDGIASAGDTLALALARQGLRIYAYNSYQSVVRGGRIWLRLRIANKQPLCPGNVLNGLVALNQEALDLHLQEIEPGGVALFNTHRVRRAPQQGPDGVQLCPIPVPDLAPVYKDLPVIQNTVLIGALYAVMGLPFEGVESVLESTFSRKGQKVIDMNVSAAKAGYDYAQEHFQKMALALQVQPTQKRCAVMTGNEAFGLGAVAAGVRMYVAYPMTPASGILHWMAAHGPKVGICVRQPEDEIAVMNMTIGANHAGIRAMCGTSGGGFALMTEAVGMAGMIETPVVCIEVQRGGPSTGLPTKTEQGDLYQAMGAGQGDYPRLIVAPRHIYECFDTIKEVFNLADKYQLPVIVLSDLLLSEHHETVDPERFDFESPGIDRGELITEGNSGDGQYLRYKITETGVSPRAIPGTPGYLYVAPTDEHDEDSVLISDIYTDPVRRKRMMEKRMRKMDYLKKELPPPQLEGPEEADVTLVGWGSTWGVIKEAIEALAAEGIQANHLQIKYLVPFHSEEVTQILSKAKKIIIVEQNFGGQFARHLRSETGIKADGHIRKYDGEPFEPKHVVAGVKQILSGETEVVNCLSEEPGWQYEHPVFV